MKRLFFSVLFTCVVTMIFAQDLKTAKSYLDKKQLDKAKTEVDAYVAKSPADAEGNYMKGKVYQQIAANDQYKSLVTGDARQEAFDAFKKAMADSNDKKMMLINAQEQYKPIIDLYSDYYGAGAKAFNDALASNNKAGFEEAANLFIKADNVGQYLAYHKWARIGAIDTVLVFDIAQAAVKVGKNDTAKTYFIKLADANITGTAEVGTNNDAYGSSYRWLTQYYKEAKDEANMMKYSSLGKRLYPNDEFYDLSLMDYYRSKKDNDALFKAHEQFATNHPDSLYSHYDYAMDISSYLYNGDEGVVVNNRETLLNTLHTELEKAHTISPASVSVNILYAQYYNNLGAVTLTEASKIKGTKPEDVKKKADLIAQAKANLNSAIPYADKALTILEGAGYKKSDKSRYKSIVNLLENIYQNLDQKDKVKLYNDKYDAADSKFVN
jgi:hypothetical protein